MTEQLKKIYEAMADKRRPRINKIEVEVKKWWLLFVSNHHKLEEWWYNIESRWDSRNYSVTGIHLNISRWGVLYEKWLSLYLDLDENEVFYYFTWEEKDRPKIFIPCPVMIGDVLDLMEKNKINTVCFELTEKILFLWKDKRKPIEEQSQECIDFVESLIPKE